MRKTIVIAAGAIVAVAAFCSAFAQAGQQIAPQIAAMAFPPDGSALAAKTEAEFVQLSARAKNPALVPPPILAATALAAYRQEPLEPAMIVILARRIPEQNVDRRLALLEAGHGLTRRSTMLNTELIATYGKAGATPQALGLIDEILRRETAAHGALLERMAAFGGDRSLQPLLLNLLSRDASWGAQFWRQLAQSPIGLANAANLRIAFAQRGGTNDRDVDRLLVAGLAGQSRFDDAARLGKALFPSLRDLAAPGTREMVRNADFSFAPDIVPFDWQLISTGDFGAGLQRNGGPLLVSAIGGSRGVAAEQLIALPRGALRLNVATDRAETTGKGRLVVELTCADQGSKTLFRGDTTDMPALIAAADCRWAWLRLAVQVPEDADGQEWIVRRVSVIRAES